ncbi:multicopper oxidase family protein [Piscinibacter gummiphilus]|uniref:Copper oxidase n=1 Tax=Piscinibacter gummiphilus TaxID=946333 RepID=A0A1W6L943_9BURK|nr:copper oxidase [Piscinibacter gummiphilus]ARN20841.1 copper oxidase [Piscinibacter gummiphilus]ATU65518.1 copper oxidase [Piscinibacter gummiphilus]GLS94676.1 exported copper oxidase [Piscinibacter gummiphilus]
MTNRRTFFKSAGATFLGAAAVSRAGAALLPEAPVSASAATQPPPLPPNGRPFNPIVTLNGWSLPWRMKDGVKEFHLVAEPVVREIAPGMTANLWGYNGSSPGPTIEAVEGDRVRIFVTNKLPEVTTVHWHGVLLPSGMDGVSGLTQPPIGVGKTFMYEFVLQRPGTHMYHPHADEMVQMAMGMMGLFIIHPKDPRQHRVDRDFGFMLNAYDIEPGSATPRVNTMLDFNLWTWNSRAFPGIDPFVARTGDRVRIRVGNLTMTNHPIHMHGPHFEVTGTDGGWVPKSARWPEVTTDVAVGQMRAFEFDALAGDWAIHCHKSHHTMNAMGHDVPTMIGVDQGDLAKKIAKLVPNYMAMGDKGMHDMAEMEMPLPDNTLPMMTGTGPFGPIGMGGMFSVVKVRDDVARGDFRDPGPYRHPAGTLASEYTAEVPEPARATPAKAGPGTSNVRKPGGHAGHH